jgi:hypothetical protein
LFGFRVKGFPNLEIKYYLEPGWLRRIFARRISSHKN